MPVLFLIDLDYIDGRDSLHLDTIILDPISMLTERFLYQIYRTKEAFHPVTWKTYSS